MAQKTQATKPQTTHDCVVPECGREIPTAYLMCREHWSLLATDSQRRVNYTYRAIRKDPTPESVRAYREAREAAVVAVLLREQRIREAAR